MNECGAFIFKYQSFTGIDGMEQESSTIRRRVEMAAQIARERGSVHYIELAYHMGINPNYASQIARIVALTHPKEFKYEYGNLVHQKEVEESSS